MFQPTYPIRTDRLTLRPVTLDDLDDIHAYQRRPDVVRWMLGAEPRTRAQSRESVLTMATEAALRQEGDCLTLAAVISTEPSGTDLPEGAAAGGVVIGTVELVWRSRRDRTAELGYVFHPDHTGRGLATEAAAALVDWGFAELGLHRVYARCNARNERSARLMTRLGMRQEAHHIKSYLFHGEWADQLVYATLAHEWQSRATAAPTRETPDS